MPIRVPPGAQVTHGTDMEIVLRVDDPAGLKIAFPQPETATHGLRLFGCSAVFSSVWSLRLVPEAEAGPGPALRGSVTIRHGW